MKTILEIQATEKDVQCLLEALQVLDEKFGTEMAVSSNAEQIALLQNDQAYLRLLFENIKQRGVQLFGEDILNFDRDIL